MKKLMRMLLVVGCLAAVSFGAGKVMAQGGPGGGGPGGGGFGGRMQQRLDDLRTQLDVKDDAEWGAISNAMMKVFEARMAGFAGGRGGRNRGGNNNGGGDQAGGNNNGGQRRFGPPSTPESEALQKAIDSKASADEIKSKLTKLREANKARRDKAAADLAKAQEDLKALLTSRQEAILVVNNMLE
jgi:Spy/CpxP family protein refolding chaperone